MKNVDTPPIFAFLQSKQQPHIISYTLPQNGLHPNKKNIVPEMAAWWCYCIDGDSQCTVHTHSRPRYRPRENFSLDIQDDQANHFRPYNDIIGNN